MTKEEMQAVLADELKAFKENAKFVDEASQAAAIKVFKDDMETKFEALASAEDVKEMKEALETQGTALKALELATPEKTVSFKESYTSKLEEIEGNLKKGIDTQIFTTRKDVLAASVTDGTLGYRETAVGQIPRGIPFMRDLFQVVQMGSNTQNTARWFEQTAVTNNANTTGEERNPGTQSDITWAEKTISGQRIVDWIKIGLDQIKDVNFVQGEVTNLVNRNMRLKENDQLINGDGTGTNLTGLLEYAKEFVTAGVPKIKTANLIDLVGKIKTQIDTDMLGAAMPNTWISNREDTDAIRYEKNSNGNYLFQDWALGISTPAVGGMGLIENPLMTANTLVAGDFSLGTIFSWDDLAIEFAQINDDKKEGKVTILAYMRENLRVKNVDKNGFVKVSDIDASIAAITDPVA